jgi:hypothetical protein
VDGDAGGEESGLTGGKFLGLVGSLLTFSWIFGGGLVISDGGKAASDGWRPDDAIW